MTATLPNAERRPIARSAAHEPTSPEPSVTPAGDTDELLATALAYAAAGWPVHPCKRGAKEPDTAHGCKDATTDPEIITAWWSEWPGRNLAIATGAPGPDVLDVDVKPGGSGGEAYGRLKRAGLLSGASRLVKTPSGGLHIYFAGTAQGNGRLPARYVDFRSRGGYVLAPPSVVGGRHYELLDARDENAAMDWRPARRLLEPPRPTAPARPRAGTERLATWVAALAEGSRNDGLFWAACRAAEAGDQLEPLLAAAVCAGLPEAEARRTVESAARRAAQ